MNASKKTAGVSTLPQEILFEILSKLPAKSLLRFKCVSKLFCTLISDHGFGVLHRSLSLTLPSRAGVLISIESRPPHAARSRAYYTLNFSEEENPRRRRRRGGMLQANRLAYLDAEPILRASSSDGLICVSTPHGDLVVCNVSTGRRIFLPTIQSNSPPFSNCTPLLGYDSESKRYKVLISAWMVERGRRRRGGPICVEYKHWVFTVGVDKSWREVKNHCSYPFYPFDGFRYPSYSNTSVYIDGVIYSYNSLSKHSMNPRFHIVAFEVSCESFFAITLPDEVSSLSYSLLKKSALLEVGGRLTMVLVLVPELGRGDRLCYLDVWTWEKSKECWENITVIIPLKWSRMISNARFLRLTTSHDGEIVLLCIYSEQFFILVCNLKSEVWRKFDVRDVDDFPIFSSGGITVHNVVDHVFSLE